MIAIVAHVICDNVKNVIDDIINVIEINVTNVWFNIIVKNDIIKKIFDDDDDEIDVLWFWIIDEIDIDVKISNLIFLIWYSSTCLYNWILFEYLIE